MSGASWGAARSRADTIAPGSVSQRDLAAPLTACRACGADRALIGAVQDEIELDGAPESNEGAHAATSTVPVAEIVRG
jgi:hypothetical protein